MGTDSVSSDARRSVLLRRLGGGLSDARKGGSDAPSNAGSLLVGGVTLGSGLREEKAFEKNRLEERKGEKEKKTHELSSRTEDGGIARRSRRRRRNSGLLRLSSEFSDAMNDGRSDVLDVVSEVRGDFLESGEGGVEDHLLSRETSPFSESRREKEERDE
jgi:hypothetical protein